MTPAHTVTLRYVIELDIENERFQLEYQDAPDRVMAAELRSGLEALSFVKRVSVSQPKRVTR